MQVQLVKRGNCKINSDNCKIMKELCSCVDLHEFEGEGAHGHFEETVQSLSELGEEGNQLVRPDVGCERERGK